MKKKPRTVELNTITKIEGHAKLLLNIGENNEIKKCELQSIEGSRYFEGMLKGRRYFEVPEITSRVCGICSCAHVVTAIEAIEKALCVKVTRQTRILRELFTVGERIRSHVTHMYFLSLPDYLGAESGFELAKTHKAEVLRALRLMKLGNDMICVFAGRDLHPVSAAVGGFLHFPKQEDVDSILKRLKESLPDAIAAAGLFSRLKYRKFEKDTNYCSLFSEDGYPIMEGDIYCSKGGRFPEEKFSEFFKEYHDERSTANFVVRNGRSYMVGALSRMNNNYANLNPKAKKIAKESGFSFPSNNPFLITFAQAVEVVHFIESAIEMLGDLKIVEESPVPVDVKAGKGTGLIEVPRGMLVHEYELDSRGIVTKANIVTPTVQNLRLIEDSIRDFLPSVINLDNDAMTLEIEKLIRAFDPCFSCSTHFLDVTFEGVRSARADNSKKDT